MVKGQCDCDGVSRGSALVDKANLCCKVIYLDVFLAPDTILVHAWCVNVTGRRYGL
jgi:hypothetical protein